MQRLSNVDIINNCFIYIIKPQAQYKQRKDCKCEEYIRNVRKVKNVCAYNPRSCFIVPDQSCGVFSRL